MFSSRSLWASICSLLHSSMILFTSPLSRVELAAFVGNAEDSDFSKLVDMILLNSMSCCKGEKKGNALMELLHCCGSTVYMVILSIRFAACHRHTALCLHFGHLLYWHTEVQRHRPFCGRVHSGVPFTSGSSCFLSTVSPSFRLCGAKCKLGVIWMLIMNWKQLLGVVLPPGVHRACRLSSYHRENNVFKMGGVDGLSAITWK